MDIDKVIASLIENNLERICKFTVDIMRDKTEQFQVDFKIAFEEYLINAYSKYSKVKTLLYKTEPKDLYSFFVCNNMLLGKQYIDASDLRNIFDISHFCLIKGSGGIGKSTMMKHFFIKCLRNREYIPVFIELKDINSFDGGLLSFIINQLKRLGWNLDNRWFEYALEKGAFLFLFDGYDEVSEEKSCTIFQDINEMCDRYRKNYFIISSRQTHDFIDFQRFTILDVVPFDKKQALELVGKLEFDCEIKDRFLEALDKELFDRHESFASNPLLLTIMLLTYDNYAEIPEKLHIFYDNAFETLYAKHDATKSGYKREMRCKLSYDIFKKIFAEFCFRTYVKNEYSCKYDIIIKRLREINKYGIGEMCDEYLWDLCNSVCVLFLDGIEYRFTHRSFQEYFTAYYLKECTDEQQEKIVKYLLKKNSISVSDKVLGMLCDMSVERYEKNVILPILKEIKNTVKDNDEYKAYFKFLVPSVSININESSKLLKGVMIKDGKQLCIWEYINKYDEGRMNFVENIDICLEKAVIAKMGTEENLVITSDLIFEDDVYYNYLKSTYIGNMVDCISKLYEKLVEKERKNDLDIETLFS